MLDFKFIVENHKLVEENARNKNIPVDIAAIVELDKRRRELLVKTENLRAEQKKLTKDQIDHAKKLKQEITELKNKLTEINLPQK